ncbi:hypothetical protein GCM10018787_07340 [Streptomyces thermodiastaticus]|nr:hypothetical protein GCM10018787_07340 [Streptomyces thermodiastaticus]
MRVATGSAPLYAEIVYREGSHPRTGPLGDVPAWVSGAPAGAEGPGKPAGTAPRRRELLVPDPRAFGTPLSLSPAQLLRLRTRRRRLNEDGHLVIDVCYPSPEAARRDELTAYADHLLTRMRHLLLSPWFRSRSPGWWAARTRTTCARACCSQRDTGRWKASSGTARSAGRAR